MRKTACISKPQNATNAARSAAQFRCAGCGYGFLTPIVAVVGIQIYNDRDTYGPPIQQVIYNLWSSTGNTLATAMAPTAIPTQNRRNASPARKLTGVMAASRLRSKVTM